MSVYFSSDLHLGHRNIHNYRTRFSSGEEHDEYIMDMLSGLINKRYTYWFLGDVCFTKDALKKFSSLQKTKDHFKIVLGNHDLERNLTIRDWANEFNHVYSLVKYKEFWLSHAPIHSDELRGKVNIHGHTHYYNIDDKRYINVCVDNTDYKLISLESIRKNIKETL